MYNYFKIKQKYEEYLEWFEKEADRSCDYETQPYTFEEFEDRFIFEHEND
jgi:hypothetical protein